MRVMTVGRHLVGKLVLWRVLGGGEGGREKSTTSEGSSPHISPLPPSGLRSECRVGMGVWAMTQLTAGISLLRFAVVQEQYLLDG